MLQENAFNPTVVEVDAAGTDVLIANGTILIEASRAQ